MKQEYFLLDSTMYHKSMIRMVQVDGGPDGCGCWGKILLEGMDKPETIGDGSYYHDGRHVSHRKASWNFWRLRLIMREMLGLNEAGRRLESCEGYPEKGPQQIKNEKRAEEEAAKCRACGHTKTGKWDACTSKSCTPIPKEKA